jgi:hypothetical protein
LRRGPIGGNEYQTRSQSPLLPFAHRAIMGGASDFPNRASSPLKRPASDLEAETSDVKDDVDMINVPESDPPTTSPRATSVLSVDVMGDNQAPETPLTTNLTDGTSSPKSEAGTFKHRVVHSTANANLQKKFLLLTTRSRQSQRSYKPRPILQIKMAMKDTSYRSGGLVVL